MKRRLPSFFLLYVAACAAGATAAGLPVERGMYVREGYACEDPPNAAILDFSSGVTLATAHGEGCTSTLAPEGGARYAWHVACAPVQAGPAPARPYVEEDAIRVLSRQRFELVRRVPGNADGGAVFRLCPGLRR